MTEINKNNEMINNINIAKAAQPKKEDAPVAADALNKAEQKQVQDLGNNPQESIGRSQVMKADSLATDMKVMKNNPELVMHADQFFDYAFAQMTKEGRPDAYEQACLATAQFINEFSKKQQIAI